MNVGANFWMDWEREGHVEIFGGDGENHAVSGLRHQAARTSTAVRRSSRRFKIYRPVRV